LNWEYLDGEGLVNDNGSNGFQEGRKAALFLISGCFVYRFLFCLLLLVV